MIERCCTYFLLLVLFVGSHTAEGIAAEEEEVEYAEISVVAIGQPFQRKYRNSSAENARRLPTTLPILEEVPQHAVPPSRLYFKKGKKSQFEQLNVGFNSQGVFTKVPANKLIDFYTSKDADDPLITFPLFAPQTRTVVFMIPAESEKPLWLSKPKIFTLNIGERENNAPQIFLANLSTQFVRFDTQNNSAIHLPPFKKSKLVLNRSRSGSGTILSIKGMNDKKLAAREVIVSRPRLVRIYVTYDSRLASHSGRTIGVFRATY